MNKGGNQPRGKVEKPKDVKRVLSRLGTYVFRYRALFIGCLILTMISNLINLIGPYLAGEAIDAISLNSTVNFERVFQIAVLMLILYFVSSLMAYVLGVLSLRFSQRIVQQMRKEVFEKITKLPVGYFDSHQAGDIMSRISYDIDTINVSLSNDIIQISTSVITVVGSFIMMLSLSQELVIIFFFTVPLAMLFTRFITKKIKPLFQRRSAYLGELNGFVEEVIIGQKTIKAYHQEEMMTKRFKEFNANAVEAYYKSDYLGTLTGSTINFINNISLTLVSGYGAFLYLSGILNVGTLSSFVLYSRRFSGPINEMANIMSEIQSSIAAAERVFRFLDEKTETADLAHCQNLSDAKGDVKFEHVRFGYVEDRVVIHDLNLKIEAGSVCAIVGPTGAGKTTMINLLMRFYDPQSGTISLDGHQLQDLTRSSVRANYAMVLQDTWLFQGTIFENIVYGREGATRDEVIEAAKAANIHETIVKYPKGYDTLINEEGLNISAGQKQMITIARAMLMNSPMLILDEATSNVDTHTEQKIQAAMQKLMRGKTSFVIAHRLSTIQNADLILVVQQGEIIEKGNHESLLQAKGLYANLYNSQFE